MHASNIGWAFILHFPSNHRHHQNSPLVGYIIKRRRRPVYRPYDGGGDLEVTHEVQQFYGRSREPGGHHMEAGEEEEQRSYFPTN